MEKRGWRVCVYHTSTMGKSDKKEKKKKEAKENGEEGAKGGREIVKGKVSVIAVPLAEEELQGKVLKLVGKGKVQPPYPFNLFIEQIICKMYVY